MSESGCWSPFKAASAPRCENEDGFDVLWLWMESTAFATESGAAFGDDRVIRLSYATSIDVIKKGLDRFQDFCRTL